MIPASTSAAVRAGLLRPEIVGPPAVYLAADASRHVTGRRLVAARWRPDAPDGEPASRGIADD
jgi:3-oxoacyl-[acyl-carrier protein] reductase